MSGLQCLASENIWFDKHRYDEAEKRFYEGANGPAPQQQQVEKGAAPPPAGVGGTSEQGPLRVTGRRDKPAVTSLAKAAVCARAKPPSLEVAHRSERRVR